MNPEEKKEDKILGGTTTLDSSVKMDAAKKLEEGLMDADAKQMRDLENAQNMQMQGEKGAADAQIKSVADLLTVAERERRASKAYDAQAQKRENALRYIAGVGDAISGVANLVGTAHGAAHQQQTYNAPGLMSKIESSRAQRTKKMEDLNKRIDELRQRETELKSAKSLREAQLKATHAKEQLALKQQQEATAREEAWKKKQYEQQQEQFQFRKTQQEQENEYRKSQSETAKQQWQKQYELQVKKFNEEQKDNYYNITLNSESLDLPKEKLNEANIERIFQMLPPEIRESVKGEEYTKYESDPEFPGSEPIKTTGYHAPTAKQKLAAISAYADSDIKVKNELRRLAGVKPNNLDPNNDNNL